MVEEPSFDVEMKSEGAVQVGGGNGATWLDTWWTVLIARIQGRYRPTTRIITVVTLALFLSIYSLRVSTFRLRGFEIWLRTDNFSILLPSWSFVVVILTLL